MIIVFRNKTPIFGQYPDIGQRPHSGKRALQVSLPNAADEQPRRGLFDSLVGAFLFMGIKYFISESLLIRLVGADAAVVVFYSFIF